MSAPKFLFFDLGGVLISFCNDRMVRQMSAVSGVEPDALRRILFAKGDESDLQWRFECGLLTPDEYYEQVCLAIDARPDRAALEHACRDIFGPMQASLDLAKALAQSGQRMGLLSNTNAVHWPFLTDGRYPELNEAFGLHVTSFDAQAMKPDPRVYQRAAQRAGVSAEEVFFVDDRPENVAGAIAEGFDAVVFTSTEQLEKDLRQRGLEW